MESILESAILKWTSNHALGNLYGQTGIQGEDCKKTKRWTPEEIKEMNGCVTRTRSETLNKKKKKKTCLKSFI